ncbi:B-box zinc finger protein [Pyxidicoccus sp. 3LG]
MDTLPFDVLDANAPTPCCKKHPKAPAGWRCQACSSALCPDCAVGRRMQTVELVGCGLCGGGALPILAHRSRVSLASRLTRAWRYVFTPSGLQVLAAVSIGLTILGFLLDVSLLFMKVLPLVLYGSMFWGTFFTLVRDTSRGHMELETPEFSDFFRDAVLPAIRGLVASLMVWIPAGIYGVFVRPGTALSNAEALARFKEWGFSPAIWADPFFWALLLLGVAWLPMALLYTAAGQPLSSILNVVDVVRRARRLGRDYVLTCGALVVLAVLHLVAHAIAFGLRLLDVAIVSRLLAEAVTLLVPFTAAHVLGLLLYVRGDAVGHGTPREYLEPLLGNTPPRTPRPP